jgi:hypothetical protein
MSEPRTKAGRRLLEDLPLVLGSEVEQHGRAFAERIAEAVERAILAIEAEARAQGVLHENLIAEGELERVERLEAALRALAEQWEIQPGDTHVIESRYRRDAWWFSNQRQDSLFFEPKDAVALLDALALLGSPQERNGE